MPDVDRSAAEVVEYIKREVVARATQAGEGRMQLVLVGPPRDLLNRVFNLMTRRGAADWTEDEFGFPVVVLLVDSDALSAPPDGCSSARCTWDYALTIRNDARASVILSAVPMWNEIPESIENTSEILGSSAAPGKRAYLSSWPWPSVLDKLEQTTGASRRTLRTLLGNLYDDGMALPRSLGEILPWVAVEDMLSGRPVLESGGLPAARGGTGVDENVRRARAVLVRLADACASDGYAATEGKMLDVLGEPEEVTDEAGPGASQLVAEAVAEMFRYLRETVGSGNKFARAPGAYFKPALPVPDWYGHLSWQVLEELLDLIDTRRPRGRIEAAIDVLALPRLPGEPHIVQGSVHIEVSEAAGADRVPVPSASFTRSHRAAPETWPDLDGGVLDDDDPPEHDGPMTYICTYDGYPSVRMKVVVLDSFGCLGHARIRDARSNPPPMRTSRRGPFEQEITLSRSGIQDLTVLAAAEVGQVSLVTADGVETVLNNPARFDIYLEDMDEIEIVLADKEGGELSRWKLALHVDETAEGYVHTRFEDMLISHQEGRAGRRVPRARNSQLRDLETQWLSSSLSWKGIVAAWSTDGTSAGIVDWDAGTVGDVPVRVDFTTRPARAAEPAPDPYVQARQVVMAELARMQRPIGECDLTPLEEVATEYLREWRAWLAADPVAASWTDTLAVHVRQPGAGAAGSQLTTEPAALLISPFHPIRLAWHVAAQVALEYSGGSWCPLAGVLNPHLSPSILALPLQRGSEISWRPFLAIGSDEPHWSILLNAHHLSQTQTRDELMSVLRRLGFSPEGPTGGITDTQAMRSLEDVVSILPGRATLRLGMVGGSHGASGSVKGVLTWVQKRFAEELDGDAPSNQAYGPSGLEVYDFRTDPTYPSAASLASLAEKAGERVRWFDPVAGEQTPKLDLVVFDQVETTNLEVRGGNALGSASVLGPAALYRLHVREDPGNGQLIQEGRVAVVPAAGEGLAGEISAAIVGLEASATDAGATHLQFEPNQQAIADWVERARFVTATSSQVDPAAFIRGAGSYLGYLWDYELPGVMGLAEDRAGYYLISNPLAAMRESVQRNIATLLGATPQAEPILEEISHRGIPVLKRLAAGGSRSRGEVGMLLAVRLLQDAFRTEGTGVRLPVLADGTVHMLLPVDSYAQPLERARKALGMEGTQERPDLMVVSIRDNGDDVTLRITPLEVKFRSTGDELMLYNAVKQASNLTTLLRKLWVEPPVSGLWDVCGRALLAQCLDHCFRVYADQKLHGLSSVAEWTRIHVKVLETVLGAPRLGAHVSIGEGKVVAFGNWPSTRTMDMNGDGDPDTGTLSMEDSRSLLQSPGELSETAALIVEVLGFDEPPAEPTPWTGPPVEPSPPPSDLGPRAGVADVGDRAEPDAAGLPESDSPSPVEASEEPRAGTVPREIRQQVRQAFDGFIGNELAVQEVSRDLLMALTESPPHLSKNLLFIGVPSVGKTELARRIARALGLPLVHLDGPSLTSRERLFELIDAQLKQQGQQPVETGQDAGATVLEYPPLVVFIDEVHLVSRKVQESLLTMLEPSDRRARLAHTVALVRQATFLFATTRGSELDPAVRSRCTRVDLRPYELGEVAEMCKRRMEGQREVSWGAETYLQIARLGRLVPRVAFGLADDLWKETVVSEHGDRSVLEHLEAIRRSKQLDENGLRQLDLEYLDALEKAGRPLGEDALVAQLTTVDRDEMTGEVEPVLRRLGLIQLGGSGRSITQKGSEYLARYRYQSSD